MIGDADSRLQLISFRQEPICVEAQPENDSPAAEPHRVLRKPAVKIAGLRLREAEIVTAEGELLANREMLRIGARAPGVPTRLSSPTNTQGQSGSSSVLRS